MEQPNNMMGNAMPPQNMTMNSMQRPQSGNVMQQLHAKIMDDLRRKTQTVPAGWQSTFDISQRAARIAQLVTGLRIIHPDPMHCIEIAENFEFRTLVESPNKEIYSQKMQNKMSEVAQKRQNIHNGQMNMSMNGGNNNMGGPPNGMDNMGNMPNGMGGMNMGMGMNMNMGNNGMGMGMPQMGGNNGQQNPNFPTHLQRQMQPSPLPQQANTLDPSALQNPQMQQQMGQQQQMNMDQNGPQPTPRQRPNAAMNGRGQNPGGGASNPQEEIMKMAQQMYNSLQEPVKEQLRMQFSQNMDENQRAAAAMQKGSDPAFRVCMNEAKNRFIKQRQRLNQDMQNGGGAQMGNNMASNANNAQQQTPAPQSGGQNIDFASIMGQQANAIKSAESGEQVVPASTNPNMNMSQGINPQQLQASQNNQAANPQQMQHYMAMQQRMQQEKQRHMQMNQMTQQQQQQGQNQSQLRGQPGGLNAPNALNGGQVNSPAMNMNMLNRPMAPPGQNTPSTPQPNRQGMPQTPANNPANQLAQHHQSMVNQSNSQMNQSNQGPLQAIMASNMRQEYKDKLASLPPEQQAMFIQRMQQNPQQLPAILNGLQNGLGIQHNGGQQQMGNQQQQQHQVMSGMPPNMSNAVPNFNSHPPPNQDQGQGSNSQPPNMQQKLHAHQINMMQSKAMDIADFPRQLLHSLNIQVPDDVTRWGQLKHHVQRNQSVLPPKILERVHAAQSQWFARPENMQAAMAHLTQQMRNANQQKAMQGQQPQPHPQQGAPQPGRPPSAAPGPNNGQAPPAQMVPPGAPQQPQGQPQQPPQQQNANGGMMNMNQMPIKPPSQEEVLQFRQSVPHAQNYSDDDIKKIIVKRKQQRFASQMQMQQNIRNAQMQRPSGPPNGGSHQAGPQQSQQQPPRAQQQQQPQQGPNQQANAQGQKRQQSSNDDVMEIPNPNQQPQAKGMQPNQQPMPPAPGFPKMPTQEHLDSLDPQSRAKFMERIEQMKQMEALRRAQNGISANQGPPPGQQQQQQQGQQAPAPPQAATGVPLQEQRQMEIRIKSLWIEVQQATPKGKPLQLDSEGLQQVKLSLKRLWSPVMNLDRTFAPALRVPNFGEERVKQAMRAKTIVQQNALDEQGNTKDYLSVSPADLKKLEVFISSYYNALRDFKQRQDAGKSQVQVQAQAQGQGQGQAPPSSAATQAQQPPAQPPAQTTKTQTQQARPAPERKPSQQGHARKSSSAANKAPPAPTENKTFDWGAQSPHGVPKYEPSRNELTADKLKMPPQKKRRTAQQAESQESTPAAQTGTPQAVSTSPNAAAAAAAKTQAPAEQAKKMQVPVKPEAPKFKCDDPMCEASVKGFDTEEMLKQHKEDMHQPIEDPFKFLEDALDVAEKNLKTEKPAPKPAAQPRPKPVVEAKSMMKKDVQTPDLKMEGSTPAAKTPGKPASVPPSKKPDTVEPQQKDKTLLETMADKIGFDLPPPPTDPAPPEPLVDPTHDLFQDLLASSYDASFLDNAMWLDPSSLDDITDWGLPRSPAASPDLTPSSGSGASQSSRESDVGRMDQLRMNLAWDAFGNGDVGVPEALLQTLGLEGEREREREEDVVMGDGEEEKEKEGKGKGEEDDWRGDLGNYEALFGPDAQAGQGGNGNGVVF